MGLTKGSRDISLSSNQRFTGRGEVMRLSGGQMRVIDNTVIGVLGVNVVGVFSFYDSFVV